MMSRLVVATTNLVKRLATLNSFQKAADTLPLAPRLPAAKTLHAARGVDERPTALGAAAKAVLAQVDLCSLRVHLSHGQRIVQ